MNFNMMYKRILIGSAVVILLSGIWLGRAAWASEQEQMPEGDILIIYNDGAEKNTLEAVNDMVELLTYQGVKVTYGPVSRCLASMDRFSYVICYDLTKYPGGFSKKLKQYEDSIWRNKERSHILFVGNEYLKAYLEDTGRSGDYEVLASSTGVIRYTFDGLNERTGMVKEECFVFLKSFGYQNGSLTVNGKTRYFCATNGVITHIPVTNLSDNLIRAAFIKELAQWKWPFHGSPNEFAQYIVINKVYPYEDPGKLLEVVKLLAHKKTPFVISVMPLYVHGDYPAMVHFCEVLRYAQANGGAVIINAPINQMISFDKDIVLEYLQQSLELYNKNGVYPLALQVPRNWMVQEDTIEIMSHFKTIFTSEEEDSYMKPSNMRTNLVYEDGHQWVGTAIALDDFKTSYLSTYSTAVMISMEDHIKAIREKVEACRRSSVSLKSLWDMEHSYWLEKSSMTYKNNDLLLNGKKMDLTFVPSTYNEKYDYHRNMLQRFSKDLTSQNRKLVILVGITSVLFLIFIFLARYNNRRNYFFQDEENEQ